MMRCGAGKSCRASEHKLGCEAGIWGSGVLGLRICASEFGAEDLGFRGFRIQGSGLRGLG